MRLIKMLGLTAFSAMAALASLGAGTAAAAAHEQYGLCKSQELLLCAAGNLIPVGSGELLGTATNPTWEGTLTETCKKAAITGQVTGVLDEVGQLKGKIGVFKFTECSPCPEITVENLPYTTALTMGTIGGNDWSLNTTGIIKATFNKCFFGSGSCIFGANEVKTTVEMAETGATVNANKAPFEFKGGSLGEGFCGKLAIWNAKFALKWTLTAEGKEDLVFPTLLGEA
jgi:hypothetical protein